ncbi:MAG: hypothetical protein LBD24_03595, partial [Spirochaetaceae bacterium]|nr:hypothetical protein [Spirochaetaceae bacterium]
MRRDRTSGSLFNTELPGACNQSLIALPRFAGSFCATAAGGPEAAAAVVKGRGMVYSYSMTEVAAALCIKNGAILVARRKAGCALA